MRKIFISMAAMLAIVSCSKDELAEIPTNFADDLTFKAAFEKSDSRVSISEGADGFKMAWSNKDEIAVYTRTIKTEYSYNPDEDVFTKTGNNAGESLDDYYYAVYPYSAASQNINAGTVTLDLPSLQYYAEKSFGLGANTMVAICPKPTDASEPAVLEFKNVGGYLRLNLYGDNVSVKSIELKGNNDENLAGNANVTIIPDTNPELVWTSGRSNILLNCGSGVKIGSTADEATEFWFVVPPISFEKGFNVRITDVNGLVMTQSLDETFEISRNTIETMNPLMVEFDNADSDVILDVQFNADGTATDNGKYMMEIVAKPGERMETITDADYPYGNVVKFSNCDGQKNADWYDSFYMIDYTNAEGFKNDLNDEDGFTLEMVVEHGILSSYASGSQNPWQNPVTSNTFGIQLRGADNGNNAGKLGLRHCTEANNGATSPFTDTNVIEFAPCLNRYYHYVYAYDKANTTVNIYCNGVFIGAHSVETLGVGNRFAIGGYPASTSMINHSFTGNVALVRMYDVAMTEDTAKARYESLNIPSNDTPVGEPLFDAQFNADGTAQNVGTANLSIETISTTGLLTTIQRGDKYVANFTRPTKTNAQESEGFYYVDYSGNADYINKLNDGYTMEIVCKVNNYAGDFWSKPFSSSTAGIHHKKIGDHYWGCYGNTPVDNWGTGIGYTYPKNYFWVSSFAAMDSYDHLLLVYDADSNVFTLYVNGKHGHSYRSPNEKNVGALLAIGGLPCTNKTVYHPFVGEVAVARVYDEVMSDKQAMERFEQEKPVIDALGATL